VEQDVKAAAAGVFDRAARDYEPAGVDFFNRMGRRLVELARVAAGERVLDLGCGRGASLFPAAAAVGPTGAVLGLDLAPMMVELTAADARDLPHVQVRLGDADDPDVPPESYDVVLAGQVIFLLPSVVEALRRWARLLRPGGRIAFSSFAPRDPVAEGVMKAIAPLLAGGPRAARRLDRGGRGPRRDRAHRGRRRPGAGRHHVRDVPDLVRRRRRMVGLVVDARGPGRPRTHPGRPTGRGARDRHRGAHPGPDGPG
jgi:ubiquinone/menaquinone biosynthesis C-methylase UbiE